MMNHYVYTMDHDTGFAPYTNGKICILSGCKKRARDGSRSIENLSKEGSWVVGIGGNNTTKPNLLIYAMEVSENLSRSEFKRNYPKEYEQIIARGKPGKDVLVSRKFYYFGNKAIDLAKVNLKQIIYRGRKYKHLHESEVLKLKGYLTKNYHCGKLGQPNNLP